MFTNWTLKFPPMFGFPRQSRDSCTTRLFLLAHAQTKVPSVQATELKYMESATSPAKIEAGSDARPPSYCDHLLSWRSVLYRKTLGRKP